MGVTFFLFIVLVLGFLARSRVVVLASIFLILISEINGRSLLVYLSKHGIEIGLIFLLISILSSLLISPVDREQLISELMSKKGVAALIGGLLATRFNDLGLSMLREDPQLIAGIILGSLLGISFLGGIPVGPLTAAGLAALFRYVFKLI